MFFEHSLAEQEERGYYIESIFFENFYFIFEDQSEELKDGYIDVKQVFGYLMLNYTNRS